MLFIRTVDLRNQDQRRHGNSRGRANSVFDPRATVTRAHDSVGKVNFIPGFLLYSTTIELSCGSLSSEFSVGSDAIDFKMDSCGSSIALQSSICLCNVEIIL